MITQKDVLGCGIASVAFILNISYDEAMALFKYEDVCKNGVYCKQIVEALSTQGKDFCYKYIKPHLLKETYKPGVIVFIRRSEKYPAGHYLVRTFDGWHDSWINFQKDQDIHNATAGTRKRLPGKPIYIIFPT